MHLFLYFASVDVLRLSQNVSVMLGRLKVCWVDLVLNLAQGHKVPLASVRLSMISKYHNHLLQTNPQHRENKPKNTDWNKTSGRQLK